MLTLFRKQQIIALDHQIIAILEGAGLVSYARSVFG